MLVMADAQGEHFGGDRSFATEQEASEAAWKLHATLQGLDPALAPALIPLQDHDELSQQQAASSDQSDDIIDEMQLEQTGNRWVIRCRRRRS